MARRAGGHIDRDDGRGWVLDEEPQAPVPEFVPQVHDGTPAVQAAGGWVLSPPAEPGPVPEPEPALAPEPESAAPTNAEVRAWALASGIEVPARGRLPNQIVEQYLNRET